MVEKNLRARIIPEALTSSTFEITFQRIRNFSVCLYTQRLKRRTTTRLSWRKRPLLLLGLLCTPADAVPSMTLPYPFQCPRRKGKSQHCLKLIFKKGSFEWKCSSKSAKTDNTSQFLSLCGSLSQFSFGLRNKTLHIPIKQPLEGSKMSKVYLSVALLAHGKTLIEYRALQFQAFQAQCLRTHPDGAGMCRGRRERWKNEQVLVCPNFLILPLCGRKRYIRRSDW